LGQISDLANTGEIFEALTAEEISSAHSWLVDVSHLMLALAAASKLVILAVQDENFRTALLGGSRAGDPSTLPDEMDRLESVST